MSDQSSEVESTSDASTATSTEQMASKHTQGNGWRHCLKTVIIALLATTGSAQEAYVNMAGMRNEHGIPEVNLEQQYMLRDSRNWPGLVLEKKESEKKFGSPPEENMATYEGESHGRKLLLFGKKTVWKKAAGKGWSRLTKPPSRSKIAKLLRGEL